MPERPPVGCNHDHEWVDIEEDGLAHGQEWKDYRIECEAIVLKTYASEDERAGDRQPMYPPVLLNPNNSCQVLRPIRWRVYYKRSRAYVEATLDGDAVTKGIQHIRSRWEGERVNAGLGLLMRMHERSGRRHKYDDLDLFLRDTYEAHISVCDDPANEDRYSVEKISAAMHIPISRDTWYATVKRFGLIPEDLELEARRRLRDHRKI